MANLLPPEKITERRHIQLGRLLLTVSSMLGLASVVLILSVLPAYISFSAELSAHDTYLAALDEVRAGIEKEERNELIYTQKRLQEFKEIFARPTLSDSLAEILALRPEGMQVESVAYTLRQGEGSISISGNVGNRESVRAFADSLYGIDGVLQATIPVQSLVRSEGTFDVHIRTEF